jgi:hypothetical protein
MTDKPRFETFRRYKVTEGDTPIVALHLRGIFVLNNNAYKELGEPPAVELLYAPDEQIVGFKASNRESPDAYAVRHHTKTAHQVEGRAFLKYYNIPEEATGRRYRAEMIDDILVVDLKGDNDEVVDSRTRAGET